MSMYDIAYVFQGDIYCQACGEDIIRELRAEGVQPSEDSDEWPQGVVDGGGEADTPWHCGSGEGCLNREYIAEWDRYIGCPLWNPLTEEGYRYVAKRIEEEPDNPVCQMWLREVYPEVWDYLSEEFVENYLEEGK